MKEIDAQLVEAQDEVAERKKVASALDKGERSTGGRGLTVRDVIGGGSTEDEGPSQSHRTG